MPNGYTDGFGIERRDFLDVLQVVLGDSVVGMGLSVAPVKRLGDVSASQMTRWLEGCKHDVLGVEEESHAEYTAFVHVEATAARQAEILGLVISPSSPVHNPFRTKLKRKP